MSIFTFILLVVMAILGYVAWFQPNTFMDHMKSVKHPIAKGEGPISPGCLRLYLWIFRALTILTIVYVVLVLLED